MDDEGAVCLDLPSVLHQGVSAWRENFFWPVSTDDYGRLLADLYAAYKQGIVSCGDPEIQTTLLGSHVVPSEFSQVLMALKTVQCIREAGFKPIADSRSDLYRPLLESDLFPASLYMRKWHLKNVRWKRLFKRHINLLLSFKYNLRAGGFPRLGGSNRKRRLVALYKPAPLCEEYITSLRQWVHLRLIATWFGQEDESPLPDALARKLDRLVEETACRAVEVAKVHGIAVDDLVIVRLRGIAES